MSGTSSSSYTMTPVAAVTHPILSPPLKTLPPYHTYYMDCIEDLTNSNLQIPFWSMPPSVHGKLNDGVGGYDVAGAGRAYEGQEGVQHPLLVSMYSLYTFSLFGCGSSTVWIQFNPPSDSAEKSENTFLLLAAFTTLLIGQASISSMVQGTWRSIQNSFIKHHQK